MWVNAMNEILRVHGSLFRAFLNAGESLRLLLEGNVEHLACYREDAWYELDEFKELIGLANRYANSGKILEQIGIEMMKAWYRPGPGHAVIASSLDFINLQTGSQGFVSVVSGPDECTGRFTLEQLDRHNGVARIHSSTIFPRELERGILIGGLGLTGDLLYYTVDNTQNKDDFDILFVDSENRLTIPWKKGNSLDEIHWRFRHHVNMTREKELFWACITDTLNSAYAEMRVLATLDPLTEVYNRREFLRLAGIELEKCRRNNYPVSLLYLDIDHFKHINDRYGHEVGDRALKDFAKLLRGECREYDLLGRLGGEEFCILLPIAKRDAVLALAERILAKTRGLVMELPQTRLGFTVSIGIALHEGRRTINELIGHADKAMLEAKQSGRDRISELR